jgi:multicomponent Na+:H+ antiporter subunit D
VKRHDRALDQQVRDDQEEGDEHQAVERRQVGQPEPGQGEHDSGDPQRAALVGGAVLRVAGGVFYGLGDRPAEDPQMAKEAAEETSETTGGKDRTPLTMLIPPAILVVATLVVGLIGQLGPAVQAAAVRFEDQAGYNATVLEGTRLTHPVALSASGPASVTVADVLTGLGSVAGALILAWLALYWRRLPLLRGYRPNASVAAAARRFQSGVVNDYVTWIVIGLTCLGALFAAIIGSGVCS